MPKLAANLSTLFLELPMDLRPAAAAKAGFKGVELRFLDQPFTSAFIHNLRMHGLEMVLFNANPGNLAQGELGLASSPDRFKAFTQSIVRDLVEAKRVGAKNLHVMAGMRDENLSSQEQFNAAVNGYRAAAALAEKDGVGIVVEPLAPSVVDGYFIPDLATAIALVEAVDAPNFKILFDYFHMQLAGGNITQRFAEASHLIGHVQIASTPARHEPDTGELSKDFLFDALHKLGYSGWVGCEYSPKTTTLAGLHWAEKWLQSQPPSVAPSVQASPLSGAGFPEGVFVGRVWGPEVGGPIVVALRDGILFDITSNEAPMVRDICEMDDPAAFVAAASGRPIGEYATLLAARSGDLQQQHLLAPCDLQVVKACGVTFARSMVERVIEEQAAGDPAKAKAIRKRVQALVGDSLHNLRAGSGKAKQVKAALIAEGVWSQYLEVGIGPDAEVFSKAQVLSSVGQGAKVGLHPSSVWNNPEPELVLAVSSAGKIVGASLGNDVNLRDIEGRSALLLSKAKDNNASCAIGPFIRLLDRDFTLDRLRNAEINLRIDGPDGYQLTGQSSMAGISRDIEDLVAQTIGRHHQYPDGLMLFLGTAFAPTKDRDIPGEGFTHKCGDRVSISCRELGELVNIVDLSTQCPEWRYGMRELMSNLARRGLI